MHRAGLLHLSNTYCAPRKLSDPYAMSSAKARVGPAVIRAVQKPFNTHYVPGALRVTFGDGKGLVPVLKETIVSPGGKPRTETANTAHSAVSGVC